MCPVDPETNSVGLFGPDDVPRSGVHSDSEAAKAGSGFNTYARVAIDQGIAVDHEAAVAAAGILTYGVPDSASLSVGQRVRVPLGRRRAEGWILALGGPDLLDGFAPARVRPIDEVIGDALPEELIELATWTARYYQAAIGVTLAGIVPAAVKARTGARDRVVLERAEPDPSESDSSSTDAKLSPSASAAWSLIRALDRAAFPIAERDLADRLELKTVAPIRKLVRAGLLTERSIRFIKAPDMFNAHASGTPTGTHAPASPPPLTSEQQTVTHGISQFLSAHQQGDDDGFSCHLLHGVTGSGKTEVYLRLVDRVIQSGKTAIVLVPEIALTPQTVGRFLARFRDIGVAVLHSALPASVRNQQWHAARHGDARVIIGARSAVFAPTDSLGVIIVDEEHDSSYKQDQAPRYHARDVAIKRAQMAGCPVLLGSATPSLETWAGTISTDDSPPRVHLWSMAKRVGDARMPEVRLIDIVTDRPVHRPSANTSHQAILTPTLRDELTRTLEADQQAILMLNRRGIAGFLCCVDTRCGWRLTCDSCDTSFVLHEHRRKGAARRFLRCHHCLHEQLVPDRCPACLKPIARLNPGTQSAERELEDFMLDLGLDPGAILRRVDTDTMRSGRDYFDTLDAFGRKEIRVLLGTQMLAKGLDFPGVRLVGVLNADIALGMPEFRAAERTFQLICQVAGRAGRGDTPGLVLIQTGAPDDPVIQMAASGAYREFAERELMIRSQLRYPPSTRQVRVTTRDKDAEKAHAAAQQIASSFRTTCGAGGRVEGPMPAVISRINERYRFTVDLFADSAMDVLRSLRIADRDGLIRPGQHQAVDVDPLSLL